MFHLEDEKQVLKMPLWFIPRKYEGKGGELTETLTENLFSLFKRLPTRMDVENGLFLFNEG